MKLDEIRELLRLMKEQKVAHFTLDNLTVTFAPHAFLNDSYQADNNSPISEPPKTPEDIAREEDEILFHSALR